MRIYLLCAGMLVLLSCSPAGIIHSWSAKNHAVNKYENILVLGLIKEGDGQLRQKMEDHLAGDLTSLGYHAVSSLHEFGPGSFNPADQQAALSQLQNMGIGAVVTIVLLNKSSERSYVPGKVNHSPVIVQQSNFWSYYTSISQRIYAPGYYKVSTHFNWESNLYDVATKQLLYSVQTESFDPSSSESLAHEYGHLIVKDMIRSSVISRQKPDLQVNRSGKAF